MEPFSYAGTWWLPSDDERRVTGTISFTQDDALRLELNGLLGSNIPDFTMRSFPIIHGIADKKLITLLSSRTVSEGMHSSVGPHSAVKPEALVFDVHLDDEAVCCTAVAFDLSHLSDWACMSGVTMLHEWSEEPQSMKLGLEYVAPEPVRVDVEDFHFHLGATFRTKIRLLHEYRWIESVSLKVSSGVPMTIPQWSSQIVRPLGRFIDFATGVHNRVVDLRFYFPDPHPLEESGLKACPAIFAVLDHGIREESSRHKHEMLFMLSDIREELGTVLEHWLTISHRYPEFFDLYFGATYETRSPLRERFYSIVRALESYHRQVLQTVDASEEEHFRRVDELLKMIPLHFPSTFEEWVDGKLRYGYEPTLNRRVKEMVTGWESITSQLLRSSREKEQFVRGVVNTRNCLTHFGKESCASSLTGPGIFLATEVLIQVASAYLIQMTGIDHERAAQLVSGNEHFAALKRRIGDTESPWKPVKSHLRDVNAAE